MRIAFVMWIVSTSDTAGGGGEPVSPKPDGPASDTARIAASEHR
jgi:hypothetical protein